MRKRNIRILTFAFVALGLIFLSAASGQMKERAQGYREYVNAMKITDLNARIKELERIKAAYPQAKFLALVENALSAARIGLADSIEPLLELQKTAI